MRALLPQAEKRDAKLSRGPGTCKVSERKRRVHSHSRNAETQGRGGGVTMRVRLSWHREQRKRLSVMRDVRSAEEGVTHRDASNEMRSTTIERRREKTSASGQWRGERCRTKCEEDRQGVKLCRRDERRAQGGSGKKCARCPRVTKGRHTPRRP